MPLREGQLTLALDDLRDPGNLGTILRLADWYGVSQIDGESTHALRGPLFSAQQPGVLVIGNESKGISAAIASQLSERVSIPCFGGAESLNAGVATGILLDQWRRDAQIRS